METTVFVTRDEQGRFLLSAVTIKLCQDSEVELVNEPLSAAQMLAWVTTKRVEALKRGAKFEVIQIH